MIDVNKIVEIVSERLDGSKCFLVDVHVSKSNEINVEIDSSEAIDIDFCVELSRFVESKLDRDVEDYELTVGSAGITSPFKVKRQYDKNVGNNVEVLASDGRKHRGILVSVDEESFRIDETVRERREGDKRKKEYVVTTEFRYDEVKYTCCLIEFK